MGGARNLKLKGQWKARARAERNNQFILCRPNVDIIKLMFAVLEDWYHHIVLTHSCKLVSFFTYFGYNGA